MGKRSRRANRNGGGDSGAAATEFTGTTPGLEDAVFTYGTPMDAAVFEDTAKRLGRHLGMQPWKEISVLSTALTTLTAPVFNEPAEPKRLYWTDDTQEATTIKHKVGKVLLDPVDDAALHAAKYQAYVEDRKTYKAESSAWKENRTRA